MTGKLAYRHLTLVEIGGDQGFSRGGCEGATVCGVTHVLLRVRSCFGGHIRSASGMVVERTVPASASSSLNLSRFHRVVLGWDYLRLLRESNKRRSGEGLKRVKSTFDCVEEYISVFEPLLFEEVKAQIIQGKDEEEAIDWQRGAVASCQKSDEFHKVSLLVQDEFNEDVSDNDLLLLTMEKFQEGEAPSAYAFALVDHRGGRGTISLVTYLSGDVKQLDVMEVESSPRSLQMLSFLNKENCCLWILKVVAVNFNKHKLSKWELDLLFIYFLKRVKFYRGDCSYQICNLSTIMREYVAMHSVAYLPFKNLVLSVNEKSHSGFLEDRAWDVPKPLMKYLEDNLNSSQLDALHAGLSRKPFVLIQGPPGTGKTQTILGLLSAILHSSPKSMCFSGGSFNINSRITMSKEERLRHWRKASPWLTGLSPRDLIMPIDGDDGFYPVGNELEFMMKVEQKLSSMDHSTTSGGKFGASIDRDKIRASILDESAIVFSTLSFSGSALFNRMNRMFDVVIIDEAAQAVEPATLVPLAHGCKQVFLIGDPVQLPATVVSPLAEKFGYGTSLFKRFQEAGFPVQMLKTQYRMHPEISIFPSKEFYSGSLEDGESLRKQTERSWHVYRCFGPFSFFDIDGVESQPSGTGSWVNEDEIKFILLMYHKLVSQFSSLRSSSQLAIISPYRYQVKLLRERFQATFGERSDEVVDINTVDGFQGREKDMAIFSCVRSNSGKGIGFLSDFRRMNVGITRARSSVLVVGSASTLMQDDHWSNLVNNAKERGCYFKVSKPYESFFHESNLGTFRVQSKMEKRTQEWEAQHIEHAQELPQQMDVGDQEGLDEDRMDADYEGYNEDY
ncbi:hypothetical protein HPP92_018782 [Vanilla planifolia]|uniref:Helicase MAGATAMA 3 n=1 Tax=Vanilla planifolia TaxID=51239 RepID=A0A835UKB9_VANPL|nr:hypothetical protein HPP92_018782 [Vanilla planifolia]